MNYQQTVNVIENKRRFGKACGREVTTEMLDLLNHPEKGMKILHIAGTNGKGSTAAFCSSILQSAGFKVGTFTSPHLIKFNERIMVNGQQISDEDVARIGTELLALTPSLEPTMFDYCLAMGLLYFKEQKVTHVVLETGLGGEKDSTSGLSVLPEVCAITGIGLEHTAILGDTIEAIAAEKAGIVRPGAGKCVIGESVPESAKKVIREACANGKVPFETAPAVEPETPLGLFGKYQRLNAGVAVAACRAFGVNQEQIEKGLKNARWPGRMQIISKEPFIMVDGAHNPNGVEALYEGLVEAFGENSRFTFIAGVMADKDYHEMMRIVEPLAARFLTLTVDSERALQAAELADSISKDGIEAKACTSFEEALDLAKEAGDKTVIFGSLYFIGDVLKFCQMNTELV